MHNPKCTGVTVYCCKEQQKFRETKPISQEAAQMLLKACKRLLAEIVRLNDAKITAWGAIAKGEEAIALVERGE